ncbi:MAG: hypothetical protein R3B99_16410 [Polyangiales bacterium]
MPLVAFAAPLVLSVLVFAATLRLSPRGADATLSSAPSARKKS